MVIHLAKLLPYKKFNTRLERPAKDKPANLVDLFICDKQKKVFITLTPGAPGIEGKTRNDGIVSLISCIISLPTWQK
jgi:hypothetical protein